MNVAIPISTAGGTYEVRLFANNAYTRLAVGNSFTITGGATSVLSTPSSIAAGGSISVSWSGVPTPTSTDWVGVYPSGAADQGGRILYQYTSGAASGSMNVAIPISTAGGTYEVRLFANNAYTRLAVGNSFTITGGATSVLSTPSSIAAGGSISVSWSGVGRPTCTERVGVSPSGAADEGGRILYQYTSGAASGSMNVAIPISTAGGTYEVRLFANNAYTRLAVGNSFTITGGATSVLSSPSSIAAGGSISVSWSGVPTPTSTDWVGVYPSGAADQGGRILY